jgi:hypothetical protein
MSDQWASQYLGHWPTPTMSQRDYEQTRGCPDRSYHCSCCGFCPVRLEREHRAAEHDRKRRDWRHNRWGDRGWR